MNDSVNRYEELAKAYNKRQQENEEGYEKIFNVEQVLTNGYIAELQKAMAELPDGQAVSAQVAVNKADISQLENKTNDISRQNTQSEEEALVFETDGGVQVGKIDANGADFTNLKRGGQQVARLSDLPTKDTSIGDNPSTTHVPTTKAVKEYVDENAMGDLPISGTTTQSSDEEIEIGNDAGTSTYVKAGSYGLKSKGYFDEDGNQVIPKIFRCGSTRTYTKVKDVVEAAVQYQDSIVYLDGETFDILAEFGQSYLENLPSGNCGIFLKNGIHIIGTAGTKLLFNYTGSVEVVNKYFSVFDSAKEGNGYTLENLTIECKNCRYCVHDDRGIDPDIYFNNFIRCNMKIDNTQNANWTSNQCIGGGFARHANILIEDCRFISLGQTNGECVTYHNTASDDQTAQSSLIIRGCVMNTTCLITNHGSSPKVSTMMVSNCKLGSNPRAYNNPSNPNNTVEVVFWNIEIANS